MPTNNQRRNRKGKGSSENQQQVVRVNLGYPGGRPGAPKLGRGAPRPPQARPRSGQFMSKVHRYHPSAMVHINPFSRYSEGAKIIDGYKAMRVSYPVPASDILTTDASGNAQMLVLPNMSCSALVLTGTLSNTTSTFSFAPTTVATTPYDTPLATVGLSGLSMDNATNLRSVGNKYRIVGWGVIVKTLPGVSSPGRILMTKFTASGKAPLRTADISRSTQGGGGPINLQAGSGNTETASAGYDPTTDSARRPTISAFIQQQGLPSDGSLLQVEALRRIPTTTTSSIAALGVNALLIRGKRTSNEYLMWKGTGPTYEAAGEVMTGVSTMDNPANAARAFEDLGIVNYSKGLDLTYMDMSGHDGLAIAITGAAASTGMLDFELVYHIEVTPKTQSLLTSLRPPVNDEIANPAVARIANVAHETQPHFQQVPHAFREMINGVVAGIGGKATRAVASAMQASAGSVVGSAMARGLSGIGADMALMGL